jgi:hypothetical protein
MNWFYGMVALPASHWQTLYPMKTITYTSISKSVFALTVLFSMFFSVSAVAQTADKTIQGTVRFSEDNDIAPGVNIFLKGSTGQGTVSDAKGFFKFPEKLKTGDVIVFSFIGRATTEYVVPGEPVGDIQIVMAPNYIEMVEEALVEGGEPSRIAKLFRKAKNNR